MQLDGEYLIRLEVLGLCPLLSVFPENQVHVLKHGLDDPKVFVIDGLPEELVDAGEQVGTELVTVEVHTGLREAQAKVVQGLLVGGIEESQEEGVQEVLEKGLGEKLGKAWEVVGEVLEGWRRVRG